MKVATAAWNNIFYSSVHVCIEKECNRGGSVTDVREAQTDKKYIHTTFKACSSLLLLL